MPDLGGLRGVLLELLIGPRADLSSTVVAGSVRSRASALAAAIPMGGPGPSQYPLEAWLPWHRKVQAEGSDRLSMWSRVRPAPGRQRWRGPWCSIEIGACSSTVTRTFSRFVPVGFHPGSQNRTNRTSQLSQRSAPQRQRSLTAASRSSSRGSSGLGCCLLFASLGDVGLRYVVIRPTADVAMQRATERGEPWLIDPAPITRMYEQFTALGAYESFVVDTSALTVDESIAAVDRILAETP